MPIPLTMGRIVTAEINVQYAEFAAGNVSETPFKFQAAKKALKML